MYANWLWSLCDKGIRLEIVFLFQWQGLLEECHQYKADYLFQPDKFYDISYDIGIYGFKIKSC